MAKVQAKDIYNQVLQKVWELKNGGETRIVYAEGLGDYFNVYMYGNEYIEGIVVEWNGMQKKVALPDENAINNDKIVARAIMSGFAQLYLGKNVDPYQKPVNENKQIRNTSKTMKQTIKIKESRLREMIREAIENTLDNGEQVDMAHLSREQVENLRKDIKLNSLFISDYENRYGIDPHEVCDFFDGFMSYLTELEKEKYGKELDNIDDFFREFDTPENLWDWYCMIEWNS